MPPIPNPSFPEPWVISIVFKSEDFLVWWTRPSQSDPSLPSWFCPLHTSPLFPGVSTLFSHLLNIPLSYVWIYSSFSLGFFSSNTRRLRCSPAKVEKPVHVVGSHLRDFSDISNTFSPSPPPLLLPSFVQYNLFQKKKNYTFKCWSLPFEFEELEARQVGFFHQSSPECHLNGPFIAITRYMVCELTTAELTQEDLWMCP